MTMYNDDALDSVEIVDTLMSKFSAGIVPTGDEFNRALELGIDIEEIKLVVGGTYGSITEDEDTSGSD